VRETAAVAVSPPVTKNKSGGGPSRLVIFVVTDPDSDTDTKQLATDMQQAIRSRLNPLFKIHEVRIVDALPRTASNKVMRRELRAKYEMETST
jgi:acetyl-CoA synthetase